MIEGKQAFASSFFTTKRKGEIMATKLVIKESSVTASQLSDFFRQIKDGGITGENLQAFLERKNPFEVAVTSGKTLQDWKLFYKKYFGIELGRVVLPKKQSGFDRLLVVAEGLTNNSVYTACEKRFPCYRYDDDLDSAVPTSERDPKGGSYAVWVRDSVEADEVHKNKSAEMIKKNGLATETLLERMLHELVYFLETKKHLDIKNVTLCSGSRDRDGSVPHACWNEDEFNVRWCHPGRRDGDLRSREVIS